MLIHHLLQISTHVLGHKLRGAQISVELLLGLSDHPFASVNFIKILRPLGAVFYQLGLLLSQLGTCEMRLNVGCTGADAERCGGEPTAALAPAGGW